MRRRLHVTCALLIHRCGRAHRGGAAAAVGPVRPERLPLCHPQYQPRPIGAAPHTTPRVMLQVGTSSSSPFSSLSPSHSDISLSLSLSVCSYRPQSQFLRPRPPTGLCGPTERAPCWPGLDGQSPLTVTGRTRCCFLLQRDSNADPWWSS